MYTVLVVDDEGIARKHIENLTALYTKDFVVIGMVNNGREALNFIENTKPNLIITDVKMPVMDGLALSKIIHSEYPDINVIIVSGYQEFDYALQALKNKAIDYLLKPVSPQNFKKCLESVKKKMDKQFIADKKELIRRLVYCDHVDKNEIDKFFVKENYFAALVRNGGLPRRLRASFVTDVFADNIDNVIVFGRDEQESLYICLQDFFTFETFQAMVKKHTNYLPDGYKTTVFYHGSFEQADLSSVVQTLLLSLDKNCRVGINQELYSSKSTPLHQQEKLLTSTILQQLEPCIYRKDFSSLKKEVETLLIYWKERHPINLELERSLKNLLHYIVLKGNLATDIEIDESIEDILFFSENYEQLQKEVTLLYDRIFSSQKESSKIDTPEFFTKVTNYIGSNLSQQLSLSSVCDIFHVSQTYLSRLFKKHTLYTFNEYLTDTRMISAKKLLINQPDLLIQEVAYLVGYKDQFYFSRIFKNYAGVSPSEYQE